MTTGDRLAGVVELSRWIESQSGARPSGLNEAVAERAEDDADYAGDDGGVGESINEVAAREIAICALARKSASRQELSTLLARCGVAEHVVVSVLDGLEGDRLVDDTELAHELAERLRQRKRLGERGIARELRARGLDPGVLPETDELDERARAVDAASDRRRRSAGLSDEVAERRLAGYLHRRGFSGESVRYAVEHTRPRGPRFR